MSELSILRKSQGKEILFSLIEDNYDREVSEKILEVEWKFFTNVIGIEGKAECQKNEILFFINRLAQLVIFSLNTKVLILNDYEKLKNQEMNPFVLKYAWMMKYTDYERFIEFKELPYISPVKSNLLEEISDIFKRDYNSINTQYPLTFSHFRPEITEGKNISGVGYLESEFSVFSYRTLKSIREDISCNIEGPVERIIKNSAGIAEKI